MIFTGALKKSLNARGLCGSIKKAAECAALLLAGNRSGRRVAFRETPPKCAEFRRRFRHGAGARLLRRGAQNSRCNERLKMSEHKTINKQEIIKEFAVAEGDTGSCEVQVAILSARIAHLTNHLSTNKKDFVSRRGLIAMTSRRRKLLDYLKRTSLDRYNALIQRLKLRR